jgi:hypothetical protein
MNVVNLWRAKQQNIERQQGEKKIIEQGQGAKKRVGM